MCVEVCGICGSDIYGYDGSSGWCILLLVMGYEVFGVVVVMGSDVKGFMIGDWIMVDLIIWCGECYFCCVGKRNFCDDWCVLGVLCEEFW